MKKFKYLLVVFAISFVVTYLVNNQYSKINLSNKQNAQMEEVGTNKFSDTLKLARKEEIKDEAILDLDTINLLRETKTWKVRIVGYNYGGIIREPRRFDYNGQDLFFSMDKNKFCHYPLNNFTTCSYDIKLATIFNSTNFYRKGDSVYCLSRLEEDENAAIFSLKDKNFVGQGQYPAEWLTKIDEYYAPNNEIKASNYKGSILLTNIKNGEKKLLNLSTFHEGNIKRILWSTDSQRLFYEVGGEYPSIWELNIGTYKLNRITDIKGAMDPFYYQKGETDFILFASNYDRSGTLYVATKEEKLPGYYLEERNFVGAIDIPISIKEGTAIKFEMEFFEPILEGRYGERFGGNEEDWTEESVYKIGIIQSGIYEGDTLYRVEREYDGSKTGKIDFSTYRCIKKDNKLVIFPNASSNKNIIEVNTLYKRVYVDDYHDFVNPKYGLLDSKLFSGVEELLFDKTAWLKGLYSDKIIQLKMDNREIELEMVSEWIGDSLRKYNGGKWFLIPHLDAFKDNLVVAYRDDRYGNYWIESNHAISNRLTEFQYVHGGVFFIREDKSVLVYKVKLGEFDIKNAEQYVPFSFFDCENDATDIAYLYRENSFDENDVKPITKSTANFIGYSLKRFHWVYGEFYDVASMQYNDYLQYLESYGKDSEYESYDDFVSGVPFFLVKDPFGRWIRYINKKYINPVLCEPIIYVYDSLNRPLELEVGNVKLIATTPFTKNKWNITGSANGEIVDIVSGVKYPYLFWEGIGDILPPLKLGFVVKQNEVEFFLEEKLAILGLRGKEIKDFKEAWFSELTEKPYCFIGFYPSELINEYAPLVMSPTPDMVIRVLMGYQPLSTHMVVDEPTLIPVQRNEGFMLVEWGGVKHSIGFD